MSYKWEYSYMYYYKFKFCIHHFVIPMLWHNNDNFNTIMDTWMDNLTRYALFCTASMSPTATPIYISNTNTLLLWTIWFGPRGSGIQRMYTQFFYFSQASSFYKKSEHTSKFMREMGMIIANRMNRVRLSQQKVRSRPLTKLSTKFSSPRVMARTVMGQGCPFSNPGCKVNHSDDQNNVS